MKQTIHVSIDSNGRAKASSKNLGNQYETGVAEFEIDLSSDWQDESYFYYLVVIPPESTGIKQYAVPLSKDFIYLISSNITWYLGTFKFLIIVMNKELDASGQIPTDGVVSISDEWEGEVNKSPLKLAELAEQPENPNFTLLYTDLMALRNSVEQASNYAQTQGDYAKSVGEQLLLDKENGVFNGYSPKVIEKTNTDTQYILEISYKDDEGNVQTYETPNLKGQNGEGGGSSGNVPTKLSELTNDTGFVTNTVNNLVNYYLKSETYDKNEINTLIGNLTSLNTAIVTELPTQNISTSTIYLIANTEQAENNYYDEYLYINNVWEKIGTTQTKLDNYYTKEETQEIVKEEIEKIDVGLKELPVATSNALGGIKVGDGLNVTEDGTVNVEEIVIEATGASSNPIGTIIPFMGLTAPKDYLVCDGAVLNIADYLELATHFKNQFGSINHFGGDGTTTFAIPDLRNEFLRGYHCNGEEQFSSEVGIHQNGTANPRVLLNGTKNQLIFYGEEIINVVDGDKAISSSTVGHRITSETYTASASSTTSYIARPTNVAVLYCIKYTVSSEEIEIESTPTAGSNKIVTSGGVKEYVDSAITGALGGAY